MTLAMRGEKVGAIACIALLESMNGIANAHNTICRMCSYTKCSFYNKPEFITLIYGYRGNFCVKWRVGYEINT